MENVRTITVDTHPAEDDAERVLILARHPAEIDNPAETTGHGELELNHDEAVKLLDALLGWYNK